MSGNSNNDAVHLFVKILKFIYLFIYKHNKLIKWRDRDGNNRNKIVSVSL